MFNFSLSLSIKISKFFITRPVRVISSIPKLDLNGEYDEYSILFK